MCIRDSYYSMQYAPKWLKDMQSEQILRFLESIGNSPHFIDYEEPLMEIVNFNKDNNHEYNPQIMKQYVEVTEKYDKHRGHDILKVSPEFAKIKEELN